MTFDSQANIGEVRTPSWRWRRRRLWTASLALLVLPLMVVVSTPPESAEAWNPIGCKWPNRVVKFHVNLNNAPTTNFAGAAKDWRDATVIQLQEVTNAANRNFRVRNSNYGVRDWSGLWHMQGDIRWMPACNANGRWVNQGGVATVNNFYNSGSGPRRRGVAAHEMGHALGLNHWSATGHCAGGDVNFLAIMYPSDNRFLGTCAAFKPKADDRNGVLALYP